MGTWTTVTASVRVEPSWTARTEAAREGRSGSPLDTPHRPRP